MDDSIKNLKLRNIFAPLFFIATIGVVATDIYLPSFPAIKKGFSTSNALVQLTFSLYLLTRGLSLLFYGPYSERFGRKATSIFGISFSLVGTLLCIFSKDISSLILGRVLQGLGLGLGPALYRAILRDAFKGNLLAQFSSFITVGAGVMMALAPTLGGYIEESLGWRYNFGFIFLYTLVGILIIWKFLPETLQTKNRVTTNPKVMVQTFSKLLKSPLFMGYSLCGSLAVCGLMMYLIVSPFLFQEILGMSPVQYGYLAIMTAASVSLGGLLSSIFVKKYGRHRMLMFSCYLMLFGSLLMAFLSPLYLNKSVILIPIFFYLCGMGSAVGNCSAGALHHFPTIAGFAGSLYGSLQILISALGSFVMVYLHEKNQIPLSIALVVVSFSCFFFQFLGYHFHKLKDQ